MSIRLSRKIDITCVFQMWKIENVSEESGDVKLWLKF